MRDGLIKRAGVRQRVLGDGGVDRESLLEDFARIDVGVDVGQGLVIFGAEEGERRDQGARAHARHEFELGPIAMRRPADQQPGAKGSIVAAARQRQKIGCRQRAAFFDAEAVRFAKQRSLLFRGHRRRFIHEKARVGKSEDHSFAPLGQGNRDTAIQRGACGQKQKAGRRREEARFRHSFELHAHHSLLHTA